MNKVMLIGNLTKDPELKTTSNGISYCRFTLAVQRSFKDANGNRQADFLNIVAWRGLAENVAKYLAKGKKAAVVGEIQTGSYDAQDGTKRYTTDIIASDIEFLTPVGSSGNQGFAPPEPTPNQFTAMDDEEVPF